MVEVHRTPSVAVRFFRDLQKEGHVIFHKEPNVSGTAGNCVEYGFLKLGKDYVEDRRGTARSGRRRREQQQQQRGREGGGGRVVAARKERIMIPPSFREGGALLLHR